MVTEKTDGPYHVMTDYGAQGWGMSDGYDTAEDALEAAQKQAYGPCMVVCRVEFREVKPDVADDKE